MVVLRGEGLDQKTDMLIIGAGIAGMTMALEARKLGIRDITILEKADDIGGTWRENTYPGVACDVPSHLYSMASHPNPDWSQVYAGGAEIQAYLRDIARKENLYDLCQFNQRLKSAEWRGDHWYVETDEGRSWTAQFLVSAIGALHIPKIPKIPGADSFTGPSFHSAQWDHDVDLTDANIAVVGTGASAIQFVPEIAKIAKRVTVFQRSAPYVLPRMDGPVAPWVRRLYRRVPLLARIRRSLIFAYFEFRHRVLRREKLMVKYAMHLWHKALHSAVSDPAEREMLTPNYQIGCKRILSSNDWYPALMRDNVDVIPSGVASIEGDTITASDGTKVQADVLVWGTGFHVTDIAERLDITGADDLTLRDAWLDGMQAHLGTAVAGFPNFFILLGPHTTLAHNSVILMIEAQVRHICEVLTSMSDQGLRTINPHAEKQAAFTQEMQDRHADAVWQDGGCTSWYQDAKGHNTALWPGTAAEFQRRMAAAGIEHYTPLPDAKGD